MAIYYANEASIPRLLVLMILLSLYCSHWGWGGADLAVFLNRSLSPPLVDTEAKIVKKLKELCSVKMSSINGIETQSQGIWTGCLRIIW